MLEKLKCLIGLHKLVWPEEMGGAVMEAVNRIGQLEGAAA